MSRLGERIQLAVIPRVGYVYIRFLRLTMRLEYRNREVLDRVRGESGQYLLAFWHSRFVMMPYCYPDSRIAVLTSMHRDARMLSGILQRLGLDIARGSSTTGGAQGLRQMLRMVKDGFDLGVTPDGPKGPRRRVKAGVIASAKLSGLPIIPVAFSARPARRLGSWDRTLLPYPFGRGLFLYGEPIEVPRKIGEEHAEDLRRALEVELDRLTDEADTATGLGVEPPRDGDGH